MVIRRRSSFHLALTLALTVPGVGCGGRIDPASEPDQPEPSSESLSGPCARTYAAVLTDQEVCEDDSFFALAEVPKAPSTLTITSPTAAGSIGTLTVAAGMTYVISILAQSGSTLTLGAGVTMGPGDWIVKSGTFDCNAGTLTLEAVTSSSLSSSCDAETWKF